MKYLVYSILLILLPACGQHQEPTPGPNVVPQSDEVVDEESTSITEPIIYRTTVDELRLRDAPATKSRVLAKLPLNQKLVSLEAASEDTYTAMLNGEKVTDVWRKVRVASRGEQEVVGWVFGGGLRQELITYELMPNGAYLRELTLLPGEETAELLILDVFPEFDYSGRLSYRKTTTGLYLLNGPFEVVGKEVPNEDGFTRNISVTYLGNFADGKLDGKIQRLFQGYESESQATINFVNGRCTTGELHEEGEGMVNDYREPEMNTCTFGYLDEGLRQQFQ